MVGSGTAPAGAKQASMRCECRGDGDDTIPDVPKRDSVFIRTDFRYGTLNMKHYDDLFLGVGRLNKKSGRSMVQNDPFC